MPTILADRLGRALLFAAALAAGLWGVQGAAPAAAQPLTALPVDEAPLDPALQDLRDRLLSAVRRRDSDAVVALAAPDIHLSFGGDHGREMLRAALDGDPDMGWTGEIYWTELQTALEMGGMFSRADPARRYFCAPYTFLADFPQELDPFTIVFVTRRIAPLYAEPRADAPVIGTLSYDIAEITESGVGEAVEEAGAPYWIGLRTVDGTRQGYAVSTDFRSPIDYRACFNPNPDTGQWEWTAFIAGD
ncbi:MAG: hypothetical protein KDA49_15730 [Rhodospirillaceae bacterium]|nr:hypothetical protein [Rhodospirillaceae bacterium]MCA8933925.1 hypothetical protein [Rhodospirillaceae bacterium]